MDKKLNNLISFEEFNLKFKVENKPGKTFENVKTFDNFGVDENIFTGVKKFLTNTTDADLAAAEKLIMSSPAKKALYDRVLAHNPEAAKKLIEFFAKYPSPNEVPEWKNGKWVSRSSVSYGSNMGKQFAHQPTV